MQQKDLKRKAGRWTEHMIRKQDGNIAEKSHSVILNETRPQEGVVCTSYMKELKYMTEMQAKGTIWTEAKQTKKEHDGVSNICIRSRRLKRATSGMEHLVNFKLPGRL